jgi:hypothetical protein
MNWFCLHRHVTFPQHTEGDLLPHVTCISCGAEFDYDWKTMQLGRKREVFQKGETQYVCDPPDSQNRRNAD